MVLPSEFTNSRNDPVSIVTNVILHNRKHEEQATKLISLFPEAKKTVWLVREYRGEEIRKNPGAVERGRFGARSHCIKIREPLEDNEFKALFLHEIAHALIYSSKKAMNPSKRKVLYGDKTSLFFSETLLPSLGKIKELATEQLATTYIDDLFLKSLTARKHMTVFLEHLAEKSEEIVCDLFALYCLTKFRGIGVRFCTSFENLLDQLNLPKIAETI
jgi:hypothetical protein